MSNNINFDYKNLSPFKWFVLENFPFIEADFDALTEWQLFCKIGKEINKIIDSQNIVGEQAENLTNAFNNLKNYVDNYFNNLDIQDEINNKLNEMVVSGELQEIILNTIADFWINPVWYGAKFDGVTDDSEAIQTAIQHGNVKFPKNKRVVINNTILISNSERIIDFNECYLTTNNNNLLFQVNNTETPIINILLKNAFVNLNGGSFIKFFNCYFTEIDNIRITNLKADKIGIHYINGFNHIANNIKINGSTSNVDNISKNNAVGILIEQQTNNTMDGLTNITNFIISNSLIQRVYKGVWLKGNINRTFDTNKIDNTGFSYCDYAVESFLENGYIYNLLINTIRCEYCGYAIYNNGNTNIDNSYFYKCENGIANYNKSNNVLSFSGQCTFFGESTKTLINVNESTIDFSNASQILRDYPLGVDNNIIPTSNKSYRTTNANNLDKLRTNVIPIDNDYNFSLLNLTNGNKVIFYCTNGTHNIYNIPQLSVVRLLENEIVEITKENDNIYINNEGTAIVNRTLSSTEVNVPFSKYKISIMKAVNTVNEVICTNIGILILYSEIEGVILKNGNGSIKNFPAQQPSLYNNPITIYCDGNGNGWII